MRELEHSGVILRGRFFFFHQGPENAYFYVIKEIFHKQLLDQSMGGDISEDVCIERVV